MNHSDQHEEDIKRRIQREIINRRLYERYHWWNYWGERSFNYLFYVNAGGVITVLTFMGIFQVKPISLAGLALACFVAGLFLVGLLCKHLFYHFKDNCKALEDDIEKYDARELEYEDLLKKDQPRLKESKLAIDYANISALCIFGGISFGIISFFTKEGFMDFSIKDILMIISGASYLAGTILLALSVEFPHQKMINDGSELYQSVKNMGGPGKINIFKHRWGMILSALGYALLLASFAVLRFA